MTGNDVAARLGAQTRRRQRGDHDLNPGFEPSGIHNPAAVLVPLVDYGDRLNVLLTRRAEHLHRHANQIGFPGGRLEDIDGDPATFEAAVAGALRETEEEIGLPSEAVAVMGGLDVYITRTGFDVTPVVGLVKPPLSLTLDTFEVTEAFEIPLSFFLDETNHRRETRKFNGADRHFYAMSHGERFIWGATAGMLRNLFEVLTDPDHKPRPRP